MIAAALLAGALALADTKYQEDVRFLLDKFEAGAGHFFKAKGVDWKAVRAKFTADAAKVEDDIDLLFLCRRLTACLKDGHAAIVETKIEVPEDRRPPEQKGVGLSLVPSASGGALLVADCYGPAADAGIVAGSVVKKIDGKAVQAWLAARADQLSVDDPFSTRHAALYSAAHEGLAGAVGTRFEIECATPSGDSLKRTLTCARGGGNGVPNGPVFPPKGATALERQSCGKTAKGFGWIHLRNVPDELPAQLDSLLETLGDVKGLVLDLRANGGGGTDHDAVFSRFLRAGENFAGRTAAEAGRHYTGPLVVIVDAGTRSAGETIAGMLKESGRALVIGPTPTAGMSGAKEVVETPSGLLKIRFTVRSYRAGGASGPEIEGAGVAPHQVIAYDAKSLASGVDPLIAAAETLLEKGLPAAIVRYAGVKNG